MDTILQNRIVITDNGGNPREYFFEKPLPYPEAGSDQPVESDYLYQLERKLVHFLGRGVTNIVAAGNVNVPTSSAVYDMIKSMSKLDPSDFPNNSTVLYVDKTNETLWYNNGTELKQLIISGNNTQTDIALSYNQNESSLIFTPSQNSD